MGSRWTDWSYRSQEETWQRKETAKRNMINQSIIHSWLFKREERLGFYRSFPEILYNRLLSFTPFLKVVNSLYKIKHENLKIRFWPVNLRILLAKDQKEGISKTYYFWSSLSDGRVMYKNCRPTRNPFELSKSWKKYIRIRICQSLSVIKKPGWSQSQLMKWNSPDGSQNQNCGWTKDQIVIEKMFEPQKEIHSHNWQCREMGSQK